MKSAYSASMLGRGDRQDWSALLPLEAPWMVHLEPTAACNLRCRCCFHGDQENLRQNNFKKDFMELDIYTKAVEDIASLGAPIKTLRLFKAGESLLHPDFAEMVRLAKEHLPGAVVVLRTNGVLLRPELNRKLIEAGLDQLEVSVNAVSSQGYADNTGAPVDFALFVDNVRDFYAQKKQCHVYVKATSQFFSEEDKKAFLEAFGDISDSIFFEHIAAVWAHFASPAKEVQTQYGVRGQEIRKRKVCPFPFIMLAVNADGSVSPCANDWNRKVVLGHIAAQSVSEIWNGAALAELRRMHAQGRKEQTACGDCHFYAAVEDDFDAFAGELLDKLPPAR